MHYTQALPFYVLKYRLSYFFNRCGNITSSRSLCAKCFAYRHKLLVIVGAITLIAIVGLAFYTSIPKETLVAQESLTLAANQSATDKFTYSGSTVNQSMATGCNVPASLKINVQSISSSGAVQIYINDKLYATGTVLNTGEAMLSSGCGCSTVCV